MWLVEWEGQKERRKIVRACEMTRDGESEGNSVENV